MVNFVKEQMQMPLILLFSNFDHDNYRLQTTTTTTEFYLARPVVEAFHRDGLIIMNKLHFESSQF